VPIENANIQEVYWLAAQAMDEGQQVIPIHIFPSRMDETQRRWLESTFSPDPDLLAFWNNLADGYDYFEATRRVPWITVRPDGRYAVPPLERVASDRDAAPDSVAAPAAAIPDTGTAQDSARAVPVGVPHDGG
jgi:murein L,D-transpeptidase YafK